MKILMINKFLYRCGGAETYMFNLGDALQKLGHEVQYFGMGDSRNIVGNSIGAYCENMDFHKFSVLQAVKYSFMTIYNANARKQIRKVLEDFQPDICHLNNFNYQLTPSIILEIKKWNKNCKIVYTAHDYKLVCPNYCLYNEKQHELCEKCVDGGYINCLKGKCIHNSFAKSLVGTIESYYWNYKNVYSSLDTIICCSNFIKKRIDRNLMLKSKTVLLYNYVEKIDNPVDKKEDYVLYFGRYTWDKGIETLLKAIDKLPEVKFIFAGEGEYKTQINNYSSITDVGFKTGKELGDLISHARFSVCPSQAPENCPFVILESHSRLTPVIGTDLGGIPELIKDGETGELFQNGDYIELAQKIKELWHNYQKNRHYIDNCKMLNRDTLEDYTNRVIEIYSN